MEQIRSIDSLDEPDVGSETPTENFVSGERSKLDGEALSAPNTVRSTSLDSNVVVLDSARGTMPVADTIEEVWEGDPETGVETVGFSARGTVPAEHRPGAPFQPSVLDTDNGGTEDADQDAPNTQRAA